MVYIPERGQTAHARLDRCPASEIARPPGSTVPPVRHVDPEPNGSDGPTPSPAELRRSSAARSPGRGRRSPAPSSATGRRTSESRFGTPRRRSARTRGPSSSTSGDSSTRYGTLGRSCPPTPCPSGGPSPYGSRRATRPSSPRRGIARRRVLPSVEGTPTAVGRRAPTTTNRYIRRSGKTGDASPDRVVDYPLGFRSQGPAFKSPSGRSLRS